MERLWKYLLALVILYCLWRWYRSFYSSSELDPKKIISIKAEKEQPQFPDEEFNRPKIWKNAFIPDMLLIEQTIESLSQEPVQVRSSQPNPNFKIVQPQLSQFLSYSDFLKLKTDGKEYHQLKITYRPRNDPHGLVKWINGELKRLFNIRCHGISLRIQRHPWRYNYHFDAIHGTYFNITGRRQVSFLPHEYGNLLIGKTMAEVEADPIYQQQKLVFELQPGDVLSVPFGWYHLFESHPENTVDPLIGISVVGDLPITPYHKQIAREWDKTFPGRRKEVYAMADEHGSLPTGKEGEVVEFEFKSPEKKN